MTRDLRVLHVEDSEQDVALLSRHLARAGYDLTAERVETPEQMRAALARSEWDIILCDYSMPHFSAPAALALLKETGLDIPFIIISGTVGEQTAVEAMRADANDYLLKDNLTRLAPAIEREVREAESRRGRMRAEDAARNAEEKYRAIFDNAFVGIYQATPDGRLITANTALARMMGYGSPEELIAGVTDLWRQHYVDPARQAEFRRRIEKRGRVLNFESRVYRKDRGVIWISENTRAVRDEGGGLLYYEGFVKNISARRRAERAVKLAPTLMLAGLSALAALALIEIAQHLLMRLISEGVSLSIPIIFGSFAAVGITYFALKRQAALYRRTFMESAERKRAEEGRRHSEEKYRAIFDNASMGIFQSAPDGTLLTANSALARLLGYDSTEELLLRNLAEDVYYRKEDREELIARYEPDGAAADLELLWKRRDGSPVWVHLNFRAVKDEGGRTLHFEGFVHDVTERRRAEEALRESEGRYKGLIDSAFDGVVIHRDGVIRDANRAYAEMFGYGVEEFVGLDILELTPPEQRDLVLSKFKDAGRTYEAQGLKKDGTRIDIEVSPTECVYEGWPARMAAVRDITERKQTEEALRKSEEQLRQSQKLEAVGQLAGGVAHDFNNLLTVITGYSDILLRRFGQGDPARPKVEEIKKAAGRAASLTRQLLAFSRRQTLQPKVLDLNVLVADVSKMLRRLIGEDVEMVLALGTKAGLVKADPGQIEQVLMNLAVNARDAMPRGGKLTVETKSVYLDEGYARHHIAVNPGPYVMLAVSDTGTGMDAETQARAFEPFFTTKEVGKGTGLGLSTVYGIVKQSGGYVWVYSEVGHGTTFKIYLPTVGEVAGAEEPAALPDVPGGSETVLLVEDEEMVRDLSREILEEGGYTVIVARDGLEGLRVCREFEGRIDLVITDVVMPQAGGRELAEKAAALRPNAKVLYMSGYTEDAVVRHGVLEEEMPFIQKPFTPDALTRKVREVLDK